MQVQTLPLGLRSNQAEVKDKYSLSIKLMLTTEEIAKWSGISLEHLDFEGWNRLPLDVAKSKTFGGLPASVFSSIMSVKGKDLDTQTEFTVTEELRSLFKNYFASSIKKPHKDGKEMQGWILSFSHQDYLPTTIEVTDW